MDGGGNMSDTLMKVLLVDDEKRFRASTEKVLVRRGFAVATAATGEEALERLAERPDVVILDIRMPGMDGLTALRELKRRAPEVPVIMLSGHASEDAARAALDQGAFDFLAKPCDIDLLAAKLHEAHRSRHVPDRQEERRVGEVMIPMANYTRVAAEETVEEAIAALRRSFAAKVASDSVMETGHRSLLVAGPDGAVVGIVAITDLLEAIMPRYLKVPKPTLADAIQYSPLFWVGMFTREVGRLRKVQVREIMSPVPPEVPSDASLMEAAYVMVQQGARRLVVTRHGGIVGIIREQELFFEIDREIRSESTRELKS
jgi:DNA-binding response OmpR family regulator